MKLTLETKENKAMGNSYITTQKENILTVL